MGVLLITQLLRLLGRLESRKSVYPHPSDGCRYSNCQSLVIPESLSNRLLVAFLCCRFTYFFEFSVCVSVFVIERSQISSFVSLKIYFQVIYFRRKYVAPLLNHLSKSAYRPQSYQFTYNDRLTTSTYNVLCVFFILE